MKSFDDNVKSCLREHIQSLRILNEKLTELDSQLKDLHRKGLDEESILEEIQNVRNGVKRIYCNAKYSIIKEVEKQNREGRASVRRYGESSKDYYSSHHYDRVDGDDADNMYM